MFRQSFSSYANNITTAFGFALLLVFVFPFFWLSNMIVSSGTILLDYGFLKQHPVVSLLLLALVLVFLFFYALLVSLMVFSVRNDLSHVKMHLYLREKIDKFAVKYFVFLAAFTVITAVIASLLVGFGVPVVFVNLVLLLASASFLFLPQAIVVDEEGVGSSVLSSWDFIVKHPAHFLMVIVFGCISMLVLQAIEFGVDYFLSGGSILSLLLSLVLLIPFIEALKTYIYMNRFGILQSYDKVM
ncbi:Uncharacterised protein [uncultured archaeon]|nr:Uncharacterised protein [uncultured archaeon]